MKQVQELRQGKARQFLCFDVSGESGTVSFTAPAVSSNIVLALLQI